MSAEEENQGGLGKSVVLVILGLFVLYYGIQVMQDRGHGHHQEGDGHGELHSEEGESSTAAVEKPNVPVYVSSAAPKEDIGLLKAENARLKQEIADLKSKLYESQQKVGSVRKLLEAEALSSQE